MQIALRIHAARRSRQRGGRKELIIPFSHGSNFKIKSLLYCTCRITPTRVTRGRARFRVLAPARRSFIKAFALEASRLGSILNRDQPKIIKLISAVTLAKRSAMTCSAEDEMNRE